MSAGGVEVRKDKNGVDLKIGDRLLYKNGAEVLILGFMRDGAVTGEILDEKLDPAGLHAVILDPKNYEKVSDE